MPDAFVHGVNRMHHQTDGHLVLYPRHTRKRLWAELSEDSLSSNNGETNHAQMDNAICVICYIPNLPADKTNKFYRACAGTPPLCAIH